MDQVHFKKIYNDWISQHLYFFCIFEKNYNDWIKSFSKSKWTGLNTRDFEVCFSGAPGSGKSTSAHLLGRNHGYVFYEGDAFMLGNNPFIDPNLEFEAWQQNKQKSMKV